jgi:Amidohydrolase
MIDGETVVDAHVHVPRLSTLKPAWLEWADRFSGDHPWREAYDESGDPVPAAFDALLQAEGVDRALLFCEYSPRATGVQPIEDLLPIVEHNPVRFRLVANVNPHLHHPVAAEVKRQLDLGAIALKVHPVHGAFRPDDPELYGAYAVCAERGVPVILHSGVSSFPGARSAYGNPELWVPVVEDFPSVPVRVRARRPRLVVRHRGVPRAGQGQRLAGPGRPAAAQAPAVLPALRPAGAGQPVDLRHRLARGARPGAQRARAARSWTAGRCAAWRPVRQRRQGLPGPGRLKPIG